MNVTVNFISEDGGKTPSVGSMTKTPSSFGWFQLNGIGTVVAFRTVISLVRNIPGTASPNHTGRLSSPSMTSRPSSSVTATSKIVPLPTIVNDLTWQLSQIILNS